MKLFNISIGLRKKNLCGHAEKYPIFDLVLKATVSSVVVLMEVRGMCF